MRRALVGTASLATATLLGAGLAAAPPQRQSVVGELAALAPAEHRLLVRKDGGGETAVAYDEKTAFLRTRPGATTLEGATPVAAGDLAAGDRVLCRGTFDAGGGTLTADRVVVMAKSDIAAQRDRERQDWARRGVAGVATAVDATTHEITLRLTSSGRPESLVVDASGPRVVFRRYAPGSLRFADARPSSFSELAVGDQVRALGDRTGAGQRLAAEQVVSGAFRVVRGVVTAVDANGLKVRENTRGAGEVAVSVDKDALVRRLPPMIVARLLRSAESPPSGAASAPAAGRAPDVEEALERMPAVPLSELRRGEEIAVLGPKGPDATRLVAMKLVVWTVESWTGGRGREPGQGQPDPFADLLNVGGETPW